MSARATVRYCAWLTPERNPHPGMLAQVFFSQVIVQHCQVPLMLFLMPSALVILLQRVPLYMNMYDKQIYIKSFTSKSPSFSASLVIF